MCPNERLLLLFAGDCREVVVDRTTDAPDSGFSNVTVSIPNLTPVYPGANTVLYRIWTYDVGSLFMDISTRNISRVAGWRDTCTSEQNRYQTARLSATGLFESGASEFRANVLPVIAGNVS